MLLKSPTRRLIVVDRDRFTLTLYKRSVLGAEFHARVRYPIAVGMVGRETPAGMYHVTSRSDCPAWTMPDSDWVEPDLRGVKIPCGVPENPIRARWLGLADGIGIHGTRERYSIGTQASHGCIRMLVEDVKELYPQVPLRTAVYVI